MKKEIPILDPKDKYTHWLISKFTPIAKGARFTLEQLAKLIIGKVIWPLKCYTTEKLSWLEILQKWEKLKKSWRLLKRSRQLRRMLDRFHVFRFPML